MKTQRPLRKVLHDADFRLRGYFNSLPPNTEPYKLILQTVRDLKELQERLGSELGMTGNTEIIGELDKCKAGITEIMDRFACDPALRNSDLSEKLWHVSTRINTIRLSVEMELQPSSSVKYPTDQAGVEDLHQRVVVIKLFFENWKHNLEEGIKSESKYRVNFSQSVTLNQLDAYLKTLSQAIDGGQPGQPTATLEQTGPTIVLHEMELWEVRIDVEDGQTYLFDGHRHRAGIDVETDTYPLTMGRINYSVLFKEQWDAWCSDNADRPFANVDMVEKKVLAYWREAMAQVDTNPDVEQPGPDAYRQLLSFLNEVDVTSKRLQALLVQDVPVFQRDTTTPQFV